MIRDFILELRIRYHFYRALWGDGTNERYHWQRMASLIGRKSGRQVNRMEKARGLF